MNAADEFLKEKQYQSKTLPLNRTPAEEALTQTTRPDHQPPNIQPQPIESPVSQRQVDFAEAWKLLLTTWTCKGRASRSEYWWVTGPFYLLYPFLFIAPLLYFALCFILLVPDCALNVRRLHDTGHSGWWLCINFIPIIGTIYFLYLMCKRSSPAPNAYGPVPWADSAESIGA